ANSGIITAQNVILSDLPDSNTTLITGSVTSTGGAVTSGNNPGDTTVGVSIPTLSSGGSVTISFQVTINDPLPAGVSHVSNQGVVQGDNFPSELTDDPDSPEDSDDTETPVTATPDVEAYKTDSLFADSDGNGVPSPGDIILYQITVVNNGNQAASSVFLNDTVDPNTTLITGSVQTSQGTVTGGNSPGDTSVAVDIGTLGGGGMATISFRVTINNPLPAGVTFVRNQGIVSGG
ncbi:unnamed protein product, partial [marine sediment metagenome]